MSDMIIRVLMFGAIWILGVVGGVIFTVGSAYTSGLQVLEMLLGDSVAAHLSDAYYCAGTGLVVGLVSGLMLALGMAMLFATTNDAEQAQANDQFRHLMSGGSGFCFAIGPMTGIMLGHILAGSALTLVGLVVGVSGGFVWTILRGDQG
ncbi:MAG: hypothetical protein AAFS10_10615 [Myxococcota bacterium]